MKKIILVMLLVMLSVTTVYAGLPMIGKKVDTIYPIFLDNIRLSNDAIIIEGVSYLPVRLLAEKTGYDIAFKDKQIFLNKKGNKKALDVLIQLLDVKTNVFEINAIDSITKEHVIGEEPYIIKNGEGYLKPFGVFGKYYKYDKETTKVTISLPDREPFVYYQDSYFENPNIYYRGDCYIKLSALGLKPVIDGNTLWLENL